MTTKPSRVDQWLRTLPELEPPPGSWQRVLSRHKAGQGRDAMASALPLLALAAAVAIAAVLLIDNRNGQDVVIDKPEPVAATVPPLPDARQLDRLRRQSQQMEQMLRGLPQRPAVVRADTASLITALEDRIATLDYRLNDAHGREQQAPGLWQERVQVMDQLVRARYVEAGADGL